MATPIRDLPKERMVGHSTAADRGTCNVASHLPKMAATVPDQPAVVITKSRDSHGRAVYASITFAQLEALSNRYANGLTQIGIGRGMRTLVMVKPGVEFIGLCFALFKIGAVPVMIDPGMGIGRMLDCIRSVDPEAFVGIPLAHAMRTLRPRAFRTVRHFVTVGRRWFWGGATLRGLHDAACDRFEMAHTAPDETAAILFTSGATGPAKGVVYEHGMFDAQVRMIKDRYGIEPGEVDLPGLPLFALFNPAMGMTSVIPDMDPSHPARVDPAKIVEAIQDHRVTNTFGSPAIWSRVGAYCVERDIKLPTLRRILVAGAPVPWHVIDNLHRVLSPDADVHTPYGATESLPVSSISGREVLDGLSDRSRRGEGTCVGRPLPEMDVRIIRITDDSIVEWSDDLLLPNGQPGEIVVRGPVVTRRYYGLERATVLAKIRDGNEIWHRIGDIGYRDEEGRFWFCGRKGHRVVTEHGTMFSVPCEAIVNEHLDVARSALVGVGPAGKQTPVIVVEPRRGRFPRGKRTAWFRKEVLDVMRASELTQSIQRVLFRRSLPVDIRHNAKINREQLAGWAARKRS